MGIKVHVDELVGRSIAGILDIESEQHIVITHGTDTLVETGISDGALVEIKSGLKEGAVVRVVSQPIQP